MMARIRRGWSSTSVVLCLVGLTVGASGCGLLDASDPTQIGQDEIQNAAAAELQRASAIGFTWSAVAGTASSVAMFTDEYRYDPTIVEASSPNVQRSLALDRRESLLYETWAGVGGEAYSALQTARRSIMLALPAIRAYMIEPARSAYIGQMLAARGWMDLSLAENVCPGFPLNDLVDGNVVRSGPQTNEQAFQRALAAFDSAIVAAVDSPRLADWARIGKGRALLGLGRFAEAGAAVVDVQTSYALYAEYTTTATYQPNQMFRFYDQGFGNNTVANLEAGVGLDFVSAHDPRVVTQALGPALYNGDSIYLYTAYPDDISPILVASGIEARLIQAEAAYNTGGDWVGILNGLRDNAISPAMPHLSNSGTDVASVDLLFRERAFWLFGTGRRLGDLRRLIKFYDRDPAAVFPAAPYVPSGTYNTATSLAFPREPEQRDDPRITGCTSR